MRDAGEIQTETSSFLAWRMPDLPGDGQYAQNEGMAAGTYNVWPRSGEVTLTGCSQCQSSRWWEGSWTHVREHGSLQREQEASAVATGLVYNLCFLACE